MAEESSGLVFDLVQDAAPSKPAWGSLREVSPAMWLRLIPGVLRQVFSGREPVGGLPVVEPGQSRPTSLPEIDFNPGAPIADHGLAAMEAAAHASVAEAVAAEEVPVPEAVAESAEPASVAEVVADLAASLGVDLDAADAVAEPVAEGPTAEAAAEAAAVDAEAVAELGEAGL